MFVESVRRRFASISRNQATKKVARNVPTDNCQGESTGRKFPPVFEYIRKQTVTTMDHQHETGMIRSTLCRACPFLEKACPWKASARIVARLKKTARWAHAKHTICGLLLTLLNSLSFGYVPWNTTDDARKRANQIQIWIWHLPLFGVFTVFLFEELCHSFFKTAFRD